MHEEVLPPTSEEAFTIQHMARTCYLLDYDDASAIDALVISFERTWGTLTLETLLKVAHRHAPGTQKDEVDKPQRSVASLADAVPEEDLLLFTLVALGVTAFERARRALVPYLQSVHPYKRWASALALGGMQDERAFPLLLTMLTEFLPTQRMRQEDLEDIEFFNWWRPRVPPIFWRWEALRHDPRLLTQVVPTLRNALIATLAVESALPRPQDTMFIGADVSEASDAHYDGIVYAAMQLPWIHYQLQLVYGLGRLGACGALFGVDTPVGIFNSMIARNEQDVLTNAVAAEHADRFRSLLWRVHASMAALENNFTAWGLRSKLLTINRFGECPELEQEVMVFLMAQWGLSEGDAHLALRDYAEAGYLSKTLNSFSDPTEKFITESMTESMRQLFPHWDQQVRGSRDV